MPESYPDALARVKRLADAPANAPILHPEDAAAVALVLARITALEAALEKAEAALRAYETSWNDADA